MSLQSAEQNRRQVWLNRFWSMWPQAPIGAAVILAGVLNIVDGLRYPAVDLAGLEPLLKLDDSLWTLGSGSQIVLGGLLVMVGIGLLWRLSVAWSFAVVIMTITVGVNLIQEKWQFSLFLPGIVLLAALAFRKKFNRRATGANLVFSLASMIAVTAYGSFGSLLLGRGFEPKISDIATSFYFTVVTLSTVGYGSTTPATLEARLFVVSLIVVGLSILATITASVIGPALSGELTRIFQPEEKKMKPNNHVILAGDGPISTNAAIELTEKGVPFIQVLSPGATSSTPADQIIRGNPCEEAVLTEAGIQSARLVIAAQEDDGQNAFISLVAKDLKEDVSVLAIANSVSAIARLKLARADLVFAPNALGGRIMVDLVMGKQISEDHRDLIEGI
jgi:voltage-gated potassium channel